MAETAWNLCFSISCRQKSLQSFPTLLPHQKRSLFSLSSGYGAHIHRGHVDLVQDKHQQSQLMMMPPQLEESWWEKCLSTLCSCSEPHWLSPCPGLDVLGSTLGSPELQSVLLLKIPNTSDFVNIPQYLLKPLNISEMDLEGKFVNSHSEVKVKIAQSCLTLCDPMDCSPPGSAVHGILQAAILEWVATFSQESSWRRDWTWFSHILT